MTSCTPPYLFQKKDPINLGVRTFRHKNWSILKILSMRSNLEARKGSPGAIQNKIKRLQKGYQDNYEKSPQDLIRRPD